MEVKQKEHQILFDGINGFIGTTVNPNGYISVSVNDDHKMEYPHGFIFSDVVNHLNFLHQRINTLEKELSVKDEAILKLEETIMEGVSKTLERMNNLIEEN